MRGYPQGELGPVQVLVIGIDAPGAEEMISAEVQDLGTDDSVRVIDLLRIRKSPDGELRRVSIGDPSGLAGALVDALLFAQPDRRSGVGALSPPGAPEQEGSWVLADRLPPGSTAAILLVEHRWAIPLRAAIAEYEAELFGDAWVHPRDLAEALRVTRPADPRSRQP